MGDGKSHWESKFLGSPCACPGVAGYGHPALLNLVGVHPDVLRLDKISLFSPVTSADVYCRLPINTQYGSEDANQTKPLNFLATPLVLSHA